MKLPSVSSALLDSPFRASSSDDLVSGKSSGADIPSERQCRKLLGLASTLQDAVVKQKSNLDVMKCTRVKRRGY